MTLQTLGALLAHLALAARRDRLMILGGGAMALCAAAGVFVGGSAMTEQREAGVAFAAGALRLTLIATLVFFAISAMRRRFDAHELDLLASMPISRAAIFLAHLALLIAMAFIGASMATLAVWLVGAEPSSLLFWGGGLFLEASAMAAAALFVAVTIESSTAAMVICMGWYVLGRMLGVFLGIASSQEARSAGDAVIAWVMEGIALLMPRFDLAAQTGWLAHGVAEPGRAALDLAILAVYPALLAAAALVDFRRRAF